MINEIVKHINNQGRFDTKKELIENALWFSISSYIGILQPKILYGNKYLHLNHFGITISPSSSGKDFSLNHAMEVIGVNKEKYYDVLVNGYDNATKDITGEIADIQIDGISIKLRDFLPRDLTINIEGTAEGLYLRALAISKSFTGSLNVVNSEILDIIKQSNINRMKELYDGEFNAKIIKGTINENIHNINSNMLLFGSSVGLKQNSDIYNMFSSSLNSGIYRRAYIYYSEPRELTLRHKSIEVDESIIEYTSESIRGFIVNNIEKRLNGEEIFLTIDNEEYLDEIYEKLLLFANENINDQRYSAEPGSLNKIIRLAGLHCILNGKTVIDKKDLEYAYDFHIRCRKTTIKLFNTEPPHMRIYQILKNNTKALTKSEILERDIFQRHTFNEDMLLLEEYCYRQNEVLEQSKGKIIKYNISSLPINNLNKIVLSVNTSTNPTGINYKPLELKFFGDGYSIENMVKSEEVKSFCLVHFKKTNKAPLGHRNIDNAIEGQNCIAFDFDGGSTIKEVQNQLGQFTYIIYTTKSHTEDNNRFRLILPTKTMFYVNNEQHKATLENIGNLLDLPTFDISTRNIDRLWFTNTKAEIYTNTGELLDIMCCIADTEISEETLSKANNEDIEEVSNDKRIRGMIKYTIANAYKGNRNNSLFKLYAFIKEIENQNMAKEITYRINGMLSNPLSEREIQTLIRR